VGSLLPGAFPEASRHALPNREGSSRFLPSHSLGETGCMSRPLSPLFVSPPGPSSLFGEPPTPPPQAFTLAVLPRRGSGLSLSFSFIFHYSLLLPVRIEKGKICFHFVHLERSPTTVVFTVVGSFPRSGPIPPRFRSCPLGCSSSSAPFTFYLTFFVRSLVRLGIKSRGGGLISLIFSM
jgi:hypothetical protein